MCPGGSLGKEEILLTISQVDLFRDLRCDQSNHGRRCHFCLHPPENVRNLNEDELRDKVAQPSNVRISPKI